MAPGAAGLLVVGQGPAGTAAAEAFRRQDPSSPITVLSAEPVPCYSRPRLPEVVAGQAELEKICLYPPGWYEERKIRLELGQRAVRLESARQAVWTADGREWKYDRLILATGARPFWPPLRGLPHPAAFTLRTAEDARKLRNKALESQHALLLGGGLLGLEMGYALARAGLSVTVVEMESRLLPRQLDEESAVHLQKQLAGLKFSFRLGAAADYVETENRKIQLHLKSGEVLGADLLLVSAGIEPRIELAKTGGVSLGKRGIQVDDGLRANVPGIYAAGDAAEWRGQVVGLWPIAQAMGRVAGANAAGGNRLYSGLVPAAKLKVAGIEVWSQGNPFLEGAETKLRTNPGDGSWVKLFIKDGCLAGSVQIRRNQGAQQFKRLIETRILIRGFEEQMLEADFDFNRIPGFEEKQP